MQKKKKKDGGKKKEKAKAKKMKRKKKRVQEKRIQLRRVIAIIARIFLEREKKRNLFLFFPYRSTKFVYNLFSGQRINFKFSVPKLGRGW